MQQQVAAGAMMPGTARWRQHIPLRSYDRPTVSQGGRRLAAP
jgi:hypothetical protein